MRTKKEKTFAIFVFAKKEVCTYKLAEQIQAQQIAATIEYNRLTLPKCFNILNHSQSAKTFPKENCRPPQGNNGTGADTRKKIIWCLKLWPNFEDKFFSIWVFFHEHSRLTWQQWKEGLLV